MRHRMSSAVSGELGQRRCKQGTKKQKRSKDWKKNLVPYDDHEVPARMTALVLAARPGKRRIAIGLNEPGFQCLPLISLRMRLHQIHFLWAFC